MRFLHTADLHLGLSVTRFGVKNGEIQEARFTSLRKLIEASSQHRVDFLLIAGDLFDDNRVDFNTSRRALELLESAGMPVFVIPGNHDPYTIDSVYRRPPWSQRANGPVYVLCEPTPIPIPGGTLFPCPLFTKNSFDDPTRWIPARAPGDTGIRIGLAHGSFRDRDTLHPDDHLIERDIVDAKGLDYLALGHWHRAYRNTDRAGVVRIAYPGVHEPMGFHETPEFGIGWSAYSSGSQDLFTDDGTGRALVVTIDHAGAAPVIEEIPTGCFAWRDETRTLHGRDDLDRLINDLDHRANKRNQLLRLHLKGTLPAEEMLRLETLDARGHGGILSHYVWFQLDTTELYAEPTEEELQRLAGDGVIRGIYNRLKRETDSDDAAIRERARQSLLLLYRYAKEARR
ncbi:MAG: DNA repair exonuclease [Planctomycetes bacterium]|nr:DNA repair exonuclease [Planctomycetota bacterium]